MGKHLNVVRLAAASLLSVPAPAWALGGSEELIQLFCFLLVCGGILFFAFFRVAEAKRERREEEACNALLAGADTEAPEDRRPVLEIVAGVSFDHRENSETVALLEKAGYQIIERQTGITPEQFRLLERLRRSLLGALGMKDWDRVRKTLRRVLQAGYEDAVLAVARALAELDRETVSLRNTSEGSRIVARFPKDTASLLSGVREGILTLDILQKSPSRTLVVARSEAVTGNYFQRFTNCDWGRGRRALSDILDKAESHLERMRG